MTPRALLLRQVDALHCEANTRAVVTWTARTLGLLAGAAFLTLHAAHQISIHAKIGA